MKRHGACSHFLAGFLQESNDMKRYTAPTAGNAEKRAAKGTAQGKAKILRDNRMSRTEQRAQTIHRKGHPK
jgi:hypothetical protein